MSDNYDTLYGFIVNLGFSVDRSERLANFGDYIIEGCSSYFCVKAVRDRTIESLEARSLNDPECWYDIGLLMACLGNENMLDEELSLDAQMKFVEEHLDDLAAIFEEESYHKTKIRLEEFASLRAKMAFPRWFT